MTWLDDTVLALNNLGGKARLKDIVNEVIEIRSKRSEYTSWTHLNVSKILKNNGYGKDKFTKVSRGVYQLKSSTSKSLFEWQDEPSISEVQNNVVELQEIKQEANVLEQFESIIKDPVTTEKTVGDFLKKNPFVLGLNYLNASSEDKIGLNGRTDFLMENSMGYYDVIELKGPNEEIFIREKNGHYYIWTQTLKNAISQMMSYLYKYDILYLSQKEEAQKDVLYPKGIIVVGKRNEDERKALKIHNHFLNNIYIKTYDDILDEIKVSMDNLSRINKP